MEILPETFEEKRKSTPSLKFKQKEIKNSFGYSELRSVPNIEEGMENIYLDTVSRLTGALNEQLGQSLIYQAVSASPGAKQIDLEAEAVAATLGEMKPKDAVEGMIATQLVSLHNQMMHYMRKANEEDHLAEVYTSRFLRLNRQFLSTLQGLLKYRNRGQQTIMVQNVHVGPEGRAIVGCIQSLPIKEG